MKKSVTAVIVITSALIIALVILSSVRYLIIQNQLLFSPEDIPSPPTPKNCTTTNLTQVWEYIFKEPSSGITIVNSSEQNNKCPEYILYKTSGTNLSLLNGKETEGITKNITAIYSQFQSPFFTSDVTPNLTEGTDITKLEQNLNIILANISKLTQREITTIGAADIHYQTVFKYQPTSISKETGELTKYIFAKTESNDTVSRAISGFINGNYTYTTTNFVTTSLECTSNWQTINTSCPTILSSLCTMTQIRAQPQQTIQETKLTTAITATTK